MALCLCLALIAPVFVAPPVAEAATVSASSTPTVSKAAAQNLGALIVDFGVINSGYHQAVIKLPDGFTAFTAGGNESGRVTNMCGANNPITAGLPASFSNLLVGYGGLGAGSAVLEYGLVGLAGNQAQLTIYSYGIFQETKLGIALNGVTVPNSAEETINATVIKLQGDFPDTNCPVGKTSGVP